MTPTLCTYCQRPAGPMTVRTDPGRADSPRVSRDHQGCYEAHMQALRDGAPPVPVAS